MDIYHKKRKTAREKKTEKRSDRKSPEELELGLVGAPAVRRGTLGGEGNKNIPRDVWFQFSNALMLLDALTCVFVWQRGGIRLMA
jgi:hypothetical protein